MWCVWPQVKVSEEYLLDSSATGVGGQHHHQGDVHVFVFKQSSS